MLLWSKAALCLCPVLSPQARAPPCSRQWGSVHLTAIFWAVTKMGYFENFCAGKPEALVLSKWAMKPDRLLPSCLPTMQPDHSTGPVWSWPCRKLEPRSLIAQGAGQPSHCPPAGMCMGGWAGKKPGKQHLASPPGLHPEFLCSWNASILSCQHFLAHFSFRRFLTSSANTWPANMGSRFGKVHGICVAYFVIGCRIMGYVMLLLKPQHSGRESQLSSKTKRCS